MKNPVRLVFLTGVVAFGGTHTAHALSVNASCGGMAAGTIAVNAGGGGVSGNFTVTATNPDSSTMSLSQLATACGEDHFNWLQYAVNNGTPTATFPAAFVDPQSGGQGSLWADTLPWYWDEVAPPNPLPAGQTAPPTFIPPAGQTELSVKGPPNGSTLAYADFPSGLDLSFTTCLVSVNANNTYDTMGGFTWTAAGATNNPTQISNLASNSCKLSPTIVAAVAKFGFTPVPLPGGVWLLASGALGLFGIRVFSRTEAVRAQAV